jgi:hypothetical protein
MWTGEIRWTERDREYYPNFDTAKIRGAVSKDGKQVSFQYSWGPVDYVARFDIHTGLGTATQVGSVKVSARFSGVFKKLAEDQIEMLGGVWTEGGKDFDWKADLGDY